MQIKVNVARKFVKTTISNLFIKIAVGVESQYQLMKSDFFACQICFVGAAPRNEHPQQSIHKDCVSFEDCGHTL